MLEPIGGKYAWRTRVSECRRNLDMTIENRQRHVKRHEPGCASWLAWDIPGACNCSPNTVTVSEYRFVPTPPAQETTTADLNAWSLT